MKKVLVETLTRGFAVLILVCLIASSSTAFAQEKKEEIDTKNSGTDSLNRFENRQYLNYGIQVIEPSLLNAELFRYGLPPVPTRLFDFSFGQKRFYPSNWFYGAGFGLSFGGGNARDTVQGFSTVWGLRVSFTGGYRMINTEHFKLFLETGLETQFLLMNFSNPDQTSFGSYLSNSGSPSRIRSLLAPQFNLPIKLTGEFKMPRIFGEEATSYIGWYVGYSFNLLSNAPVLGSDWTVLRDAPMRPGGGFQAGLSISVDAAEILKAMLK